MLFRSVSQSRYELDTGEDAVTQQCFKDECDINILLAKFAVTGQLPENVRVPQYVDFEEAFDFIVRVLSVS